jgi:hypothetical protein
MEKLVGKDFFNEVYDMPVFCEKHRVMGCLAYREGGKDSLKQKKKVNKNQKQLTDREKKMIEEKL